MLTMARFDVVRQKFSRPINPPPDITRLQVKNTVSASTVSSKSAKYLIDMYNWDNMNSQDLYEWILINEPAVAAYVTKVSEMVRSAFDYFMVLDSSQFDNIAEYTDETGELQSDKSVNSKLLDKMKDTANDIARRNDIESRCFETWAAVILTQGEVFIEKHKNLSLSVIPNNRVTILDDLKYLNQALDYEHIITEENYLIIDEGHDTQRILRKDSFIHIKLSDVPINLKDSMGRATFGVYGVSPLQRCISSLWLKGQILITETLWRWGNVPREHHSLAAESFAPDQFKGYVTKDKLIQYSQQMMAAACQSHADAISKKNPDQHYVTSSNVTIKPIEHSSSDYMDSNNLLNQIENSVWDGLGMPVSVIRGKSDGSYASELVIASGVSLRVEHIAHKIGRVVLENMKERLIVIDPSFPVRYLDVKIAFELSESKLEKFKIAGFQKEIGLYTPTEIRDQTDHPALTDDQMEEEGIVTAQGIIKGKDNIIKSKSESTMINPMSSTDSNPYPTTPQSAEQQPTDKNDVTKDITDEENYR